MLKIKRIYEPRKASDGYRVLVDRLWPRGVAKSKAHIDLWLKEIGPSTDLRKWFGHDPKRWAGFKRRYLRELRANSAVTKQLKQLVKEHTTVTLVFSARDEQHNQAAVLLSFLHSRR